MNLTRRNSSLIATSILLCTLTVTGCSDDEPKLTPEQIEGLSRKGMSHGRHNGWRGEYGILSCQENECTVMGFAENLPSMI